jgi:hypothetical protein
MLNGPNGVLVNLNILQKRMGRLKSLLQRNEMTTAKTLSADVLADLTATDVLIQAAVLSVDLPGSPTLSLQETP